MKNKDGKDAGKDGKPKWLADKIADKKGSDKDDECASKSAAAKSDDGDEDEDDDEDDMDKSLTASTLRKSMEILNQLASQASETREQTLCRKAQEGSISKSERRELAGILAKSEDEPAEGVESFAKSMTDNTSSVNEEAFDVAPFLRDNAMLVAGALDAVNKSMQSARSEQASFNSALVKAMGNIGEVSAQLLERMQQVENQPARAAKSQTAVQQATALEKGFGGSQDNGNQLSKAQAMDCLEQLCQKSNGTERPGFSPTGGSYLAAISAYENSNFLDPGMAREVAEFWRSQRSAN